MPATPTIAIEPASPRDAGEIATLYLASRAGDYVVGATIAVDGGIVYANAGIKGSGWDS